MELVFLVGLPGSGKSTYLQHHYSVREWVGFDDFRASSILNRPEFTGSQNYPSLVNALLDGRKNILICDIAFCNASILEEAEQILNWWITKRKLQFNVKKIYFQNDPDQCIKNLKTEQHRIDAVKTLSPIYKPEGATIPVYRP